MSLKEGELTPPDNEHRNESTILNVYVKNMKRYGAKQECDELAKKRVKVAKISSAVNSSCTSQVLKQIPISNPMYGTRPIFPPNKDKISVEMNESAFDSSLDKFSDGNHVITSAEFSAPSRKPNPEILKNDYVIFSSDIINNPESKDNTITKFSKNQDFSFSSVDNKSSTSPSISVSSYEIIDKNNIAENLNEDITEEIDLIQSFENSKSNSINIDKCFVTKDSGMQKAEVITSSALCQNKVTLSRITNVANSSTGAPTSVAVSRTALLNQPLLITAKNKMSEVTQTTAKVSIGNTTISVPLLKPLNSKQIIQPGKPIVQNNPHHTQFNLGKLINVKQNPKNSQPTIFSLSQLQIKPASSAKIVQAKVVNKNNNGMQSTRNWASNTGSSRKVGIPDNESKSKQSTASNLVSNKLLSNSTLETAIEKLFHEEKPFFFESGTSAFVNSRKTLVFNTKNLQLGKTGEESSPLDADVSKIYKDELGIAIDNADSSENIGNNNKIPSNNNDLKQVMLDINIIKPSAPHVSSTTTQENTVFYPALKPELPSANSTNTSIKTHLNTNAKTSKTIGNVSYLKKNSGENEKYPSTYSTNSSNSGLAVGDFTESVQRTITLPSIEKTEMKNSQTCSRSTPCFISSPNQDEIATENLTSETPQPALGELSHSAATKGARFANKLRLSMDTNLAYEINKNINIKCNGNKINDFEQTLNSEKTTIISKNELAKEKIISPLRFQTSSSFNYLSKTDETNNALLKQLLQSSPAYNSGQIFTTTSSTTTTNKPSHKQLISNRKIISLRAPSLGLVSSLEAQLARPVIPPVPAASESLNQTQQETLKISQNKSNFEESFETRHIKDMVDTTFKSNKLKTAHPLISKETSFVSNPDLKVKSTTKGVTKNITNVENTTVSCTQFEKDTKPIEKDNIISKNGKFCSSFGTTTQIIQDNGKDSLQICYKKEIENPKPSIKDKFVSKNDETIIVSNTQNLSKLATHSKYKLEKTSNDEGNILQRNVLNFTNNKLKSPDDMKLSLNKIFTDDLRESLTDSRMSESSSFKAKENPKNENASDTKTLEVRRKRKREYQKHRRQLLHNKEPSAPAAVVLNTTLAKKRSRKLLKAEENYDNFINDLMSRLRVMPPQQVIEPLLNHSFCFYNMYEVRNPVKFKMTKDPLRPRLQGLYGNSYVPYVVPMYNKKYDFTVNKMEKRNLHITQNYFYDQEFLPVIPENEQDILFRIFRSMDERKIEAIETILNKKTYNDNKSIWLNAYPGLVLIRNGSKNQFDRLSPIVPHIAPEVYKMKRKPPTEKPSPRNIGSLLQEPTLKTRETDVDRQIVYLTLPSSATDKILNVMKDLATILHIALPTTYKLSSDFPTIPTKNNRMKKIEHSNARNFYSRFQNQGVLNGQIKICNNCGKSISSVGIRACYNFCCDKKIKLSNSKLLTYFCSKRCYAESTSRSDGRLITIHQSTVYSARSFRKEITHEIHQKSILKNQTIKECIKNFSPNCFTENLERKRSTEKELTDLLLKMDIAISANNITPIPNNSLMRFCKDTRQCVFCKSYGDGIPNGPSRLLNFDVNKWVHLNCALWSNDVYETKSGGLMNFHLALQNGFRQICCACQQTGATVKCFKYRCDDAYHLACAKKENCTFYKDKTIRCQQHSSKTEKDNELPTLMVHRRVFIERDEHGQVATVMYHMELSNLLRIGSLTLLNIGQLLPHQLESFHTKDYIYPIGYRTIRFYWSMKRPNKRCRYICSIAEGAGKPEFCIQVQEAMDNIELRNSSPNSIWQRVLEAVAATRRKNDLVQLFPQFLSGEELFGLTEPSIVRILESLPGIDSLSDYRFKYGGNPLLELPLAVNPTGSARTEPKQRQILGWRKPHTQRTSTSFQRILNPIVSVVAGEVACPYSKQFVHSKSSQYKKMKSDWRNNVYLARSKIQGLGLYAARDIERHTMIIEYIGEVIRTEVSEIREKQYEERNHGVYMFRLDEDRVVDATLSGGLARYINHSCNPNCVTEIVEVDREVRIIIFAKRRITRGEELSYDYKFDIEDDANKISCMCESPNCRKWMN